MEFEEDENHQWYRDTVTLWASTPDKEECRKLEKELSFIERNSVKIK